MTDIDLLIQEFRADQPGPEAAPAAVAEAARVGAGRRRRRAGVLRRSAGLATAVAGIAGVLVLSLPRGPETPVGGAPVAVVPPAVAEGLRVGNGIVGGMAGVDRSSVVRVLSGTSGGARVSLWQGTVTGGGERELLVVDGVARYVAPVDCGEVPRGQVGVCFWGGGRTSPYLSGAVGADVASVSAYGPGSGVQAVVANGRFVAVPPSSWRVATLVARDAAGLELFRIEQAFETVMPEPGDTTLLEDGSRITLTPSSRVTVRDRTGAVVSDARCGTNGYPYRETVDRLAAIQSAARMRDRRTLSFRVAYPLSVARPGRPPATITSRTRLLAELNDVFPDAVLDRIGAADPRKLFCKAEGVMLGDGVIWLQDRGGRLLIISVSG